MATLRDLLNAIHAEYDKVVGKFEAQYGPIVAGQVGNLVTDAKNQAEKLVGEAQADLGQDVGEIKTDVETDLAAAPVPVNAPAESSVPEQPTT